MAKERKLHKIKLKGKEFYAYKNGLYVRQKLGNDRNCKEYRVKEVKPGRKILICITGKKGKNGGKTKAVSLLRHISVDLREYKGNKELIKEVIKKFRELKKKMKIKVKKKK